jgi:hypothetical protein
MAMSHVLFNEASQEELDAINFIKNTKLWTWHLVSGGQGALFPIEMQNVFHFFQLFW